MAALLSHPVFAAGFLASLIYWFVFSWQGPSLAKPWVKSLPMALLLLWVLLAPGRFEPGFILLTVPCALVGDFYLAKGGTRDFLVGMAAFALAHLGLIAVFAELGLAADAFRVPWGPAVLLLGLVLGVLLFRYAGALRWPVMGYIGVIGAMALAAACIQSGDSQIDRIILIAAALFVVSDSLIGLETFVFKPDSPWRQPAALVIWPTYYGAMVLFALAAVS